MASGLPSRFLLLVIFLGTSCTCPPACSAINETGELGCPVTLDAEIYDYDETLPLGFTAQQAADAFVGDRDITLHWPDGTSEPAVLSSTSRGDWCLFLRHLDPQPEESEYCSDREDTATTDFPGEWVRIATRVALKTIESDNLDMFLASFFRLVDLEEARFLTPGDRVDDTMKNYEPPECEERSAPEAMVLGRITPDSSDGEIRILQEVPTGESSQGSYPETVTETVHLASVTWD